MIVQNFGKLGSLTVMFHSFLGYKSGRLEYVGLSLRLGRFGYRQHVDKSTWR